MKLNQITKIITLALAIFQNFVFLSSAIYDSELLIGRRNFLILSSIILTSGTMACVWIGERITDYGIGQGTSVLILVGIISSLPGAIYEEYNLKAGNEMVLFLEVGVLFFITMCVVALSLAIRKIKLQYIKDTMEYEDLQASREYLPIKVISAGVMPIIFGNVILFFVAFIFNLFSCKCCQRGKVQKSITICNNIMEKYYSIENLIYSQFMLENLLQNYKWNNPDLNSIKNFELIYKLKQVIKTEGMLQ
jgi:preprotein translocase subunit SecY